MTFVFFSGSFAICIAGWCEWPPALVKTVCIEGQCPGMSDLKAATPDLIRCQENGGEVNETCRYKFSSIIRFIVLLS